MALSRHMIGAQRMAQSWPLGRNLLRPDITRQGTLCGLAEARHVCALCPTCGFFHAPCGSGSPPPHPPVRGRPPLFGRGPSVTFGPPHHHAPPVERHASCFVFCGRATGCRKIRSLLVEPGWIRQTPPASLGMPCVGVTSPAAASPYIQKPMLELEGDSSHHGAKRAEDCDTPRPRP